MKLKLIESPSITTHPDGEKVVAIFPSRPFWLVGGLDLPKAIHELENIEWKHNIQDSLLAPSENIDNYQYLGKLLREAGVLSPEEPAFQSFPSDLEPHDQIHDVETVLIISLTEGCNLGCPHCYANGGTKDRNEMTTEQVFNVVQQLTDLPWDAKLSSVSLIGGEPLLRKDILDITDRIYSLGYNIVLCTNSLLLKDDQIAHFCKYGKQIQFSISLDGASAEYHEMIRGKGTFQKTVETIQKLVNADITVNINTFVHQDNFETLKEIFALVDRLGVNRLNTNTLMYVGRGLKEMVKPVPRPILYRKLFEIARSNPRYLKLIEKSNFANKVIAIAGGFKSRYCGIGSNRALYVRSDGTFYPCSDTCIPEFQLADLNKQHLSQIWNESEKLKELRSLDIDSMNPICAKCDVRYYCAGDCRGENYQHTGEFFAPHFKCKEIRESILEIIWMLSECPDFLYERTNNVLQRVRQIKSQE